MNVIQGYTRSVLTPQLRSLGLSKRQWEIVVEDVTQRLASLLSHWGDVPFRRTMLVLGTEEASFWEPRSASMDIRSLVVVAVRNSLLEDLGAAPAYTEALRSPTILLPDPRMPWITSEAVNNFTSATLDAVPVPPDRDVFGALPRRFPNAWYVLSLLGGSAEREFLCTLPAVGAETEASDFSATRWSVQHHSVVASGIDPRIDDDLGNVLRLIERGEAELFFSPSFKGITRNPEKLLSIMDHVLRYGGTLLTPNYLFSPTYVARRDPLLRPAHHQSQIPARMSDPAGLSERHQGVLAALISGV